MRILTSEGRIFAALATVLAFLPCAFAEGKDSTVTVSYPGKPWVFQIAAPGMIETYNNHKAGVSTYFSGFSVLSGVNLSVEMVDAKQATSASECRDLFYNAVKNRKIDGQPVNLDWELTEIDGVPRMESFLAEFSGKPLRQKHIHTVYLKDGVCAKAHVSKVHSDPRKHPELEAVLKTIRFEPMDAGGTVVRSFIVSRSDVVVVKMPVRWGFSREAPRRGMPLGMRIHEPSQDFQMGVRFVDPAGIPGNRDEVALRRFVESAKPKMLALAVESDATLEQLETNSGVAFFFQVTNKKPAEQREKGGDFEYVYQGAALLQDFVVVFTIYSNIKDSPDVAAAFDLVKALGRERWRES